MEQDTVLVRYGEIGVKSSSVRRRMEERLRRNVESTVAQAGVEATVRREWSRILVETDGGSIGKATDAVTRTFGVSSASPCVVTDARMDRITEAVAEVARETYDGGSFAVRARRAGDEDAHPFTSVDVEREAGAAVADAVDAPVDLDDPDNFFGVECRLDDAYVYAEERDGPGGLPYGTQGRVVALVSGGIDSPVAAWRAMRRGCPAELVYVDAGAHGGPDHVARAYETAEALASYVPGELRLWRVDAEEAVDRLVEDVGGTRMLSYRRFMLRVADTVAERVDAVGVVTGEAVGQKSSQTARNLRATDTACSLPVHRPLLSFDKHEVVKEARDIGTYDASKVNAGCHAVAPENPETHATVDEVRDAEPDDLFALADEAVEEATREVFDCDA
ncbi:MAG: tRNA uracil 4-sulfurtransferase ThiI [Halobacteriales archaeon]